MLITGGLGFIGSNLAIRLAGLGASVTVIDSSVPGCGANPYNLHPVRDRIRQIDADIAGIAAHANAIADCRVVFNLAGEISHIHSMQFPERDMQINAVSQLQFLSALREILPGVRVVYAGTRQVYGIPEYLPASESHPINPVDFNGVHKYAAAMYHSLYTKSGDLDAIVLRLTNVYGPRMSLDVPCQGFLSTFFRRVLLGLDLEIYGDGNQLRDPVHVDDAVDAFLLAGQMVTDRPAAVPPRIFNAGGPEPLRIREIADTLAADMGCSTRFKPFPDDRKQIDIGSYYTDSSRIADYLGWHPKIRFAEGAKTTLDFYRAHAENYFDTAIPHPECTMPEHKGAIGRLRYAEHK